MACSFWPIPTWALQYLLIFANILGDVKGKGSKRSVSFDPSFVMLGMVRKSMKILNQKSCQLIIGYNWLIYHGTAAGPIWTQPPSPHDFVHKETTVCSATHGDNSSQMFPRHSPEEAQLPWVKFTVDSVERCDLQPLRQATRPWQGQLWRSHRHPSLSLHLAMRSFKLPPLRKGIITHSPTSDQCDQGWLHHVQILLVAPRCQE